MDDEDNVVHTVHSKKIEYKSTTSGWSARHPAPLSGFKEYLTSTIYRGPGVISLTVILWTFVPVGVALRGHS